MKMEKLVFPLYLKLTQTTRDDLYFSSMRIKTNFFNLSSLGEITKGDLFGAMKTRTFWGGVLGIFGVILGLMVLMHFLILPWYTMQGRAMDVPNVINLKAEEAISKLEAAGFVVDVREQYHNPAFPVGVVAEQRPQAFARVKPGRPIILFVNSESKRYVEVPNVTMLIDSQAELRLKEMGLRIKEIKWDSLSQFSKGTVIRQDPQPRSSVRVGTEITLWASINYKTPPIPDLEGMSLGEAQNLLRNKYQLRISVAYNDGHTTSITSQSPGAGSRMRINDVVRVFLGNPPVEETEEGTDVAPDGEPTGTEDVTPPPAVNPTPKPPAGGQTPKPAAQPRPASAQPKPTAAPKPTATTRDDNSRKKPASGDNRKP